MLQTNWVDDQCDKVATELRIQSRQFSATTPAFNLSHLHLAPPLGVTPFEFCLDFWHHETTVRGLSCGIVCMIIRLAISIEHQLMTDGQTDT